MTGRAGTPGTVGIDSADAGIRPCCGIKFTSRKHFYLAAVALPASVYCCCGYPFRKSCGDKPAVPFNYLCQGGAGDFVKFRQLAIADLCQQEGVLPTLTTHDDIVVRAPIGWHRSEACRQLTEILEDGSPFKMKLPVSMRVSTTNLAELKGVQLAAA